MGIDTGPDQVLQPRPAEIVHDPIREPNGGTCPLPRLAEVPDGLAVAVEDEGAVEPAGGESALDDGGQFPDQW
jgi:hypothetical protein